MILQHPISNRLSPRPGRRQVGPGRRQAHAPSNRVISRGVSVPPPSGLGGLAWIIFELPSELEASEPPEARGLARDEVRLMVSYRSDNRVVHTQFRTIGECQPHALFQTVEKLN